MSIQNPPAKSGINPTEAVETPDAYAYHLSYEDMVKHPPSVHPNGGRCGDCEPEADR